MEELLNTLIDVYPTQGRERTAQLMGKTQRWVKRYASRLGLRVREDVKYKNMCLGVRRGIKNRDSAGPRNGMWMKKRPDLAALNRSRAGIPLRKEVCDKLAERLRRHCGNTSGKNVKPRPAMSTRFKRRFIRLHGAICVECGSNERLEIDHIKPVALFPEPIKEESNLRILCRSCHQKTETYGARMRSFKERWMQKWEA
jgi:5-methylcytosine-specific restriction endonuclease McrA